MKKINIFGLLFAILFMVGCDYNEDNFGDLTPTITDQVNANVVYDGSKYPAAGYFSDKAGVQSAMGEFLKKKYPYCDAGSTAKVANVLFGDVTPGFAAADAKYTLTADDYIAMGTESGQPGKYKNFDKNMDVDSYLKAFCNTKYASLAEGKIVSISYAFYESGAGTSTKTSSYKKVGGAWTPVQMAAFTTDMAYTLVTEDYDSMGTVSGTPGRYDNFDANMDVDLYLSTFLKLKYPYTAAGKTAEVTYKFYGSGTTADRSSIYKYDGSTWSYFNPYADVVAVSPKIAEMAWDGATWTLKRLLGGSTGYKLEPNDYSLLIEWTKTNKPEYMSTASPTEEFYFGASGGSYNNFNNNYNTWRNYYNIGGAYTGKSDTEMQNIMDGRIAEGIIVVILPNAVSTPDPGISYVVTYKVYGGRGSGDYSMNFMFNEEIGKYERVSDPVPAK